MFDEIRVHPIQHPVFGFRLNKMKSGEIVGTMLCSSIKQVADHITALTFCGQFSPNKPKLPVV